MQALAQAAHAAGLQGLAFTDHQEWIAGDEATGFFNPDVYFTDLAALSEIHYGDLTLLAGIELGNPHNFLPEARAILADWPWDYALGSVHWIDELPGWEPVAFERGIQAAYQRYFEEMVRLAEEGEYDVLAHFDLVRRDSWSLYRVDLPLEPYARLIDAALTAVVARGKGLEINTSPLRRGMAAPCPGVDVLRRYRELGGAILVFGSDAHRARDVAQDFDRAREIALAAGFTQLARFAQRRVVDWIPL